MTERVHSVEDQGSSPGAIPTETEVSDSAHFDDFMNKFMAVGGVARAASASGWEMRISTNSETITLQIKQPKKQTIRAATPTAGGYEPASETRSSENKGEAA